jgi:hypothetical protein
MLRRTQILDLHFVVSQYFKDNQVHRAVSGFDVWRGQIDRWQQEGYIEQYFF